MLTPRDLLKNITVYQPGESISNNIKLASNENPLGSSPRALAAISKIQHYAVYPDDTCVNLRGILSDKYALNPENIIVGNGSDEIIYLAAAAYLNPGDEVIISRHTFSVYEATARLFGAVPIFVDTIDLSYDLDSIVNAITPKTKIIYLCNPNNPTGTFFTQQDLELMLAKIPNNILVVLDEAYYEYVTSKEYPNSNTLINSSADSNTKNNLLVLRTFSKIFGLASLRIGYGISTQNIINTLRKVKPPFNVNHLAQMAACSALGDESFLAQSFTNNTNGIDYLSEEMTRLNLHPIPTQANFICVETPYPARDVANAIKGEGVTIRPLMSFGLDRAIRVTVGTPQQNKEFIRALSVTLNTLINTI